MCEDIGSMGAESSGGPAIHTYAWDKALYLVQWLE